jgi:hypothetical protein
MTAPYLNGHKARNSIDGCLRDSIIRVPHQIIQVLQNISSELKRTFDGRLDRLCFTMRFRLDHCDMPGTEEAKNVDERWYSYDISPEILAHHCHIQRICRSNSVDSDWSLY